MAESLSVALALYTGYDSAQRMVQAVCARANASGQTLLQAALEDPQVRALLPPDELERALDPAGYLGSTALFIDRALAGYCRLSETG